ncbi:MAG: VOC family protein [Cyclobacteriaceae bacterium]
MKQDKNQMKGSPVVRFDIGCQSSEATQAFYIEVFGWKMNPSQHTTDVDTNSTEGIPGSITSLGHEPHQYIMIYIQVESVTESIESIEAHGGKHHIGPLPTGKGDFFAWVHDPGGNMLGIVGGE